IAERLYVVLPPALLRAVGGQQHDDDRRIELAPRLFDPWADQRVGRIAPDALARPAPLEPVLLGGEVARQLRVVRQRRDVDRETKSLVERVEHFGSGSAVVHERIRAAPPDLLPVVAGVELDETHEGSPSSVGNNADSAMSRMRSLTS